MNFIKLTRVSGNIAIQCVAMLIPLALMGQSAEQKAIQVTKVLPIARITGASLPSDSIPNSNQTVERWDIGGADLGIAWRMATAAPASGLETPMGPIGS